MNNRFTASVMIISIISAIGCGGTNPDIPAHLSDSPDQQRIEHFKGLPAPDWTSAITNLREFNLKLQTVVNQETITDQDMDTVHQLTYTLENAVERIRKDLEILADALEEIHQASETDDVERLRKNAATYFEYTTRFFEGK